MNFKERGITVDLLIILLLIVSTTVIVKSFNKDKKSTLNLSDQYKLSYEEILFSKLTKRTFEIILNEISHIKKIENLINLFNFYLVSLLNFKY